MKHKWHNELEDIANFNISEIEADIEPLFTLNEVVEFAQMKVKNNVGLANVRQQSELLPYDRAKDMANCNDCKILGGLCAIHDIGNSA